MKMNLTKDCKYVGWENLIAVNVIFEQDMV